MIHSTLLRKVMEATARVALASSLVSQKRSVHIFLLSFSVCEASKAARWLAVIIFIFPTIRRIQSVSFAPRSSSLAGWLYGLRYESLSAMKKNERAC